MDDHEQETESLNWTAVAALYAGLSVGIVWLLYSGDYRNAIWLGLIGTGGALTAYGRVLEQQDLDQQARRWQWAAGVVYAVFFLWAGTVLVWAWVGA